MDTTWKVAIEADRDTIERALVAQESVLDWDSEIVLAGSERPGGDSETWCLEAWLPREPDEADLTAIAALFDGEAPAFRVERLPDIDWVTESQKGLEPIRAGRFRVRTPDHPASPEAGVFDLTIPAARAFGTGHHETTAGCLTMLSRMKQRGVLVRNCADIGTGTGVLAFALNRLWPRAIITASDIDPLGAAATMENAALNGIAIGPRGGQLTVTIADGMAHPLIAARGPYDLIVANILAGPLIEMAADFAGALVPGGSLLLAGLTTDQEHAVRGACRRAGFRIAARLTRGDWSIVWLRKRQPVRAGHTRAARVAGMPGW